MADLRDVNRVRENMPGNAQSFVLADAPEGAVLAGTERPAVAAASDVAPRTSIEAPAVTDPPKRVLETTMFQRLTVWLSFALGGLIVVLPVALACWWIAGFFLVTHVAEYLEDSGGLDADVFPSALGLATGMIVLWLVIEWGLKLRYSKRKTLVNIGVWLLSIALLIFSMKRFGEILYAFETPKTSWFTMGVVLFTGMLWLFYLAPRSLWAGASVMFRLVRASTRSRYGSGLVTAGWIGVGTAAVFAYPDAAPTFEDDVYWPGLLKTTVNEVFFEDAGGYARAAGALPNSVAFAQSSSSSGGIRAALVAVGEAVLCGQEGYKGQSGSSMKEALLGVREPIAECVTILTAPNPNLRGCSNSLACAELQAKRRGVPVKDNEMLARDVLTEVCLRYETLSEPNKLPNYYSRAISNAVVDYFRVKQRQRARLVAIDDHEVPLPYNSWDEESIEMNQIVQLLGPNDRELLRLIIHGYTAKEIAQSQGISVEAAKKRVQRVRAYIADRLRDEF